MSSPLRPLLLQRLLVTIILTGVPLLVLMLLYFVAPELIVVPPYNPLLFLSTAAMSLSAFTSILLSGLDCYPCEAVVGLVFSGAATAFLYYAYPVLSLAGRVGFTRVPMLSEFLHDVVQGLLVLMIVEVVYVALTLLPRRGLRV